MLKNETGVTMDPVNLDLLQKLDGLQILIVGPSPPVLLVNHQWKIRVHFTCLWEVKWTEKQHLVESVRMIVDVKRKGGQAGTSKVCLIKCPSISHRTACHWSFKSEGDGLLSFPLMKDASGSFSENPAVGLQSVTFWQLWRRSFLLRVSPSSFTTSGVFHSNLTRFQVLVRAVQATNRRRRFSESQASTGKHAGAAQKLQVQLQSFSLWSKMRKHLFITCSWWS